MPPDDGKAPTSPPAAQTPAGKPGPVIPAKVPEQQPMLRGPSPSEVIDRLLAPLRKT